MNSIIPRRNLYCRKGSKFQYMYYNRHAVKRGGISLVKSLIILTVVSAMLSITTARANNNEPVYTNMALGIEITHKYVYTGNTLQFINFNNVLQSNESRKVIQPIEYKLTNQEIIMSHLGDPTISIDNNIVLHNLDLPSKYYGNINFSYFQPGEPYTLITDKTSPAYAITHGENAYTDNNGFRRYKLSDDQFSINGEDDYMVALGTFYKEKDTVGSRYLVVTSTGLFTVIAGDEKADGDTDPMNMYSTHGDGNYHAIIEYIIDIDRISKDFKSYGTASKGPVRAMQGTIIKFYKIEE